MEFGTRSAVLLVGALNGALLAVLLLRAPGPRATNRLLAALILLVVLRLVPFIIGYAGAYDAYPWLSFAPFDNQLALGPLLWLYTVRLTTGALPPRWGYHLLPAVLVFAFNATIFTTCSVAEKAWIDDHVVRWLGPVVTAGTLGGLALYGAGALRRYRAYQRWLDDEFSNREEYRLDWLRNLLAMLALTGLLWLGFAATDFLVTPLSYLDVFPLYVWLAALAYFLGLVGWRVSRLTLPVPGSPASDAPLPEGPLPGPADAPAPRTGPDWVALGESYAAQVRANAWWRDPLLTLPQLARRLGETKKVTGGSAYEEYKK